MRSSQTIGTGKTKRHAMNAADAAWLHMDRPTNLMIINSLLWFDEPVDWQRVRSVIEDRLVRPYPRFRQRVVESRIPARTPRWEDDPDFDLGTHIHHVALPPPADKSALQELVSDLIVRPLDRAHPLWELYAIDGYGRGAAMFCRMHHCIADGIALARVMLSLTDERIDAGMAPPGPELEAATSRLGRLARPAARAAGATRRVVGTLAHESIESMLHPTHVRELVAKGVSDTEELAKILLKPPDRKTVLKGRLHVAERAAWSEPISLDEVRTIGHATESTINDVLLSAVTGSLHDYLVFRKSLVESVRAFVPFNLRPLDRPLPRDLGNRFGLVYLDLPVGLRTAKSRLREVKSQMDAIKSSAQGAIAYAILGVIGHTPPQVEKVAIDLFSARGSCVITNVPGPRQPVYLAGTPVAGVLVWAPTSGSVSMSVSIFSYAGEVTVGLLVDAGLVPDPDRIVSGLHRELEKLGRLAGVPAR